MALLSMWRWRILTEKYPIWYDFLTFIYGYLKTKILDNAYFPKSKRDFNWWRDLCCSPELNWISNPINCKLGDGKVVSFWKFKWFGSIPLHGQLRTVFVILASPNAKVADLGV